MAPETAPASRPKTLAAYAAMLVATVGLFFLIRAHGETLPAPAPVRLAPPPAELASSQVLMHVLLALVVVIACSRLLGALFRYLHQPPVIGEVIAGILLGPSLFGYLSPSAQGFVLPPDIAPHPGPGPDASIPPMTGFPAPAPHGIRR